MSGVTNFPAALDDDSSLYDVTDNVTQIIAAHHNNLKEAVKAVEARMGIAVSPAATSLDYLLRNPSAGHRHSGASGQGRRVSHADLLDTATGNPHSIYQQATYLGQPSGYAPLGPSGLLAPSYMGYSSIATEIRFLANDQRWRNLNPTQFNLPSYLATSGLFPAADGVWRIPAGSGGGGGGGGGGGIGQSYLGYNAIGASVENMANWKAYTKTLVITAPGFLASIQAYVNLSSRSGSEAFSALLWSDNAGQPQTLLAMASTTSLARATSTGRWLSVPIGIWLPAGTYHMGFGASQVNNSQIAYDTGTDITFQSAGSFFDDYVSGDTLTTTARQYSVRADWMPAAGGSPALPATHPLDTYTMDATIGDDFLEGSLNARWTRRTIVSGDETYQQGKQSTFLRVLPGAHGVVGAGYLQPATADGEYAMKFIPRNWPLCAFGLALVDSAGTGLILQYYNGPSAYLLLDLTTYTSYGGSYTTAGFPAGVSQNVNVVPVDPAGAQIPVWLKVRKAGTSYYPSFSTDGEIWSPEGTARVWTGTMNRVGMLIGPLSDPDGASALGYADIDWFNKIA